MNAPLTPPAKPAKHHEKYWSPFGNVVLVGTVETRKWLSHTPVFCVHSSLLSEQSEAFAGMFMLPQEEGDEKHAETFEGLPLVRLPDSSEQICAMLDAIRDPLKFSEKTIYSDTPHRIHDALHMATKYLMTNVRARLVHILESEWPLTVGDLEIKDQFLHDYLNNNEMGKLGKESSVLTGWLTHFVPEPAAAIWIAEEYDIPSILPAAYYDILRCSPRADWDCYGWDGDGVPRASEKPARWDLLSRTSLQKIHCLEDFLVQETEDRFYDLYQVTVKGCDRKSKSNPCRETWVKLIEECEKIPIRVQCRDLLKQFRDLGARLAESKICFSCESAYDRAVRKARDEAWEGIEEVSHGDRIYND